MTDDGTGGPGWQEPDDRTARYPAPDERTVPTSPPRAEATGLPAAAPAPDQRQDPDDGPDGGGYLLPPAPGPPAPPAPPAAQPARPAGSPEVRGRRRRRQTLTFVGLLAGVVVVGLVAATVLTGLWKPFGSGSTGAVPLCPTPTTGVQAAALTRVRVLNASTRRGLALATARELQKRGFKVPDAPGNDTVGAAASAAALVRHGPGGVVAAHTIATQVKGKVTYEQDQRLGEVVDLVLGPTFALVDAKAGAAALKKASPSPAASCSS
jgi:LytR cell envelope-related transcriptional attenuator